MWRISSASGGAAAAVVKSVSWRKVFGYSGVQVFRGDRSVRSVSIVAEAAGGVKLEAGLEVDVGFDVVGRALADLVRGREGKEVVAVDLVIEGELDGVGIGVG